MSIEVNPGILRQMREQFDEETVEQFVRMMGAVHALNTAWATYMDAPDSSPMEDQARAAVDSMVRSLVDKPDHMETIVQALLSCIYTMRKGATYELWFADPRSG